MRAADNGSPPKHTDHSLTINILDVNDNSPVIESQKGYNVSISEVRAHSIYKHMGFFSPLDLLFLYVSACISMLLSPRHCFKFVGVCVERIRSSSDLSLLLFFCR